MKVSALADLADTTVRTVRHYHSLGLLDVPPTVGGVRDYGLDHLARLLRIKHLVASGMSLTAVAEVLPPEGPLDGQAILTELHDVLADIDERLVTLQQQRDRVAALIDQAGRGDSISPLPTPLADLYQRLLRRMPTPASRRALDSERSMAIVLAMRGMLPSFAGEFASALDAHDEDDVVAMFVAITELERGGSDDDTGRRDAVTAPALRILAKHRRLLDGALASTDDTGRAPALAMVDRLAAVGFPTSPNGDCWPTGWRH